MKYTSIVLALVAGLALVFPLEILAQGKGKTTRMSKVAKPSVKPGEKAAGMAKPVNYSRTRKLTITKVGEWVPGPEQKVQVGGGPAMVSTRTVAFRYHYSGAGPIDIPFIAFKHDPTGQVWIGPVFAHYALAGGMFFGVSTPAGLSNALTVACTASPSPAGKEKTLDQICGQFDEDHYLPPYLGIYQTIGLRNLFGTEFHGDTSGPVRAATMKEISTDGSELVLKFEGNEPKATAELVLGGPTLNLGIIRA